MLIRSFNVAMALFFTMFLINCNAQKEKVKTQILSQDFYEYSGFKNPETLLIKDQESWDKVHDQIFANESPPPGHSIIDFKTYDIVVFAFGEKSNGGYQYDVRSYDQVGDSLLFKITTPSRDPYQPVTMAITYPLVVCKIPRTDAMYVGYELKKD